MSNDLKNEIETGTIAEQLLAEIARISMAQTVQHSAYVALAQHLSVQGYVNIETLVTDLELLGSSQTDEDWQSGHAEIAGALHLLNKLPSSNQR